MGEPRQSRDSQDFPKMSNSVPGWQETVFVEELRQFTIAKRKFIEKNDHIGYDKGIHDKGFFSAGDSVIEREQITPPFPLKKNGAGDRTRTGTGFRTPADFKSAASANSATPAHLIFYTNLEM